MTARARVAAALAAALWAGGGAAARGADRVASPRPPWSRLRGPRWASPRPTVRPARELARAPAPAPLPPPFSDDDFNGCTKLPAGRRAVAVSLKPDTDVAHLIAWVSSVTCKAFVWSDDGGFGRRRLTIVAPTIVTPAHAFRIFLDALNSVGLTVQPFAGFYQIIEAYRAKTRAVPLYDWNGRRLTYDARGAIN